MSKDFMDLVRCRQECEALARFLERALDVLEQPAVTHGNWSYQFAEEARQTVEQGRAIVAEAIGEEEHGATV